MHRRGCTSRHLPEHEPCIIAERFAKLDRRRCSPTLQPDNRECGTADRLAMTFGFVSSFRTWFNIIRSRRQQWYLNNWQFYDRTRARRGERPSQLNCFRSCNRRKHFRNAPLGPHHNSPEGAAFTTKEFRKMPRSNMFQQIAPL